MELFIPTEKRKSEKNHIKKRTTENKRNTQRQKLKQKKKSILSPLKDINECRSEAQPWKFLPSENNHKGNPNKNRTYSYK